MPVFNTAKYLNEAIDSILNQTFRNFEFIIIDDASTDGSNNIIKSYKDPRIVFIENETNKGYVLGLNYAISIAKGEYIARMDSDDISLESRLQIQIQYLENNQNVDLVGSWYQILNSDRIVTLPETHDQIFNSFLKANAIAHPTVMFKKSFFINSSLSYNYNMMPAEDYDLWVKCIKIGKLANIPSVLLLYREHQNQISNTKKKEQVLKAEIIRWNFVLYYLNKLDEKLSISFNVSEFSTENKIHTLKYLQRNYKSKNVLIDNVISFELQKVQYEVFLNKANQNIVKLITLIRIYPILFYKNNPKLIINYVINSLFNFSYLIKK